MYLTHRCGDSRASMLVHGWAQLLWGPYCGWLHNRSTYVRKRLQLKRGCQRGWGLTVISNVIPQLASGFPTRLHLLNASSPLISPHWGITLQQKNILWTHSSHIPTIAMAHFLWKNKWQFLHKHISFLWPTFYLGCETGLSWVWFNSI
jgi:hypothetical protein